MTARESATWLAVLNQEEAQARLELGLDPLPTPQVDSLNPAIEVYGYGNFSNLEGGTSEYDVDGADMETPGRQGEIGEGDEKANEIVPGVKRAGGAGSSGAGPSGGDLVPEHRIFTCPFDGCPKKDWRAAFTDKNSRNAHQVVCPFKPPANQGGTPGMQSQGNPPSSSGPGTSSTYLIGLRPMTLNMRTARMQALYPPAGRGPPGGGPDVGNGAPMGSQQGAHGGQLNFPYGIPQGQHQHPRMMMGPMGPMGAQMGGMQAPHGPPHMGMFPGQGPQGGPFPPHLGAPSMQGGGMPLAGGGHGGQHHLMTPMHIPGQHMTHQQMPGQPIPHQHMLQHGIMMPHQQQMRPTGQRPVQPEAVKADLALDRPMAGKQDTSQKPAEPQLLEGPKEAPTSMDSESANEMVTAGAGRNGPGGGEGGGGSRGGDGGNNLEPSGVAGNQWEDGLHSESGFFNEPESFFQGGGHWGSRSLPPLPPGPMEEGMDNFMDDDLIWFFGS